MNKPKDRRIYEVKGFEYDPAKDRENREKHGLPLLFGLRVLAAVGLQSAIDRRFNYGETRSVGYGMVNGRLYSVAYTIRAGQVRLISVRKANRREHRRYARQDSQQA